MYPQEKTAQALRALYESRGYRRYKMSRFDDYDLYARNRDILAPEGIIAFTDTNGRLMALKPDVTASIIRSARERPGLPDKVYYSENVYRVSARARAFREILQTGLECIGAVDDYSVLEVASLAAQSLRLIGGRCVLVLSHPGVVSAAAAAAGLTGEAAEKALERVAGKSLHEVEHICRAAGCDEAAARRLLAAAGLSGSPGEVLSRLEELGLAGGEAAQLRMVADGLEALGFSDMLRVDLSAECGTRYYSGVVFKGYVRGAPEAVLSGGRYDALVRRMGRRGGAIGFAVYWDRLERLLEQKEEYDADVLLLYGEEDSAPAVSALARELARDGARVLAQRSVPEGLRFGRVVRFGEGGVEGNA